MTTFLLIVAGTCALAGGVFGLLWRHERKKRKEAEVLAENHAIRADQSAKLLAAYEAAEAEATETHAKVEQKKAEAVDHIAGLRDRLKSIGEEPTKDGERDEKAAMLDGLFGNG